MSEVEGDDKYSVADAPSIGSDPNENPNAFMSLGKNTYQTIAPGGVLTKDQVFATKLSADVLSPDAIAAYSQYLQLKSRDDPQSAELARKGRQKALQLLNGTRFSESDVKKLASYSKAEAVEKALEAQSQALFWESKMPSNADNVVERMNIYNQGFKDKVQSKIDKAKSLSAAAGISSNIIQPPEPVTLATSKFKSKFSKARSTVTTAPRVLSGDVVTPTGGSGVYSYQVIDLYDDRYDFETGKKVSQGVTAGVGGGAGDVTTVGNVETTVEQSESNDSGPVKC